MMFLAMKMLSLLLLLLFHLDLHVIVLNVAASGIFAAALIHVERHHHEWGQTLLTKPSVCSQVWGTPSSPSGSWIAAR